MSNYSAASLQYISNKKLAEMIKNKTPKVSVIDVRDSDYIGGHILGCVNVPTSQHDFRMPELVRTLKDQDAVVFHCALSQQRGPSSALRYLREREKLARTGQVSARTDGKEVEKAQTVYVLEGGFVKWQEMYVKDTDATRLPSNNADKPTSSYGEDAELTEGYVKDLWEDY